ncbi:hypothetical protein [Flaviaesturariibacter aridisoli]|uniref:Uncharacterized protein n=1 Tax=Flaviaesturariibacter aridisoli TaxID=2545761 RepID=A0A4R4DSI2_9BACT|nr:hypothetical protein [Flaviaesturariibacter aridisoli]TCZ64706.1 hypothetical protein E0486_17980 [Flaviaesturariibacter aridisoli]
MTTSRSLRLLAATAALVVVLAAASLLRPALSTAFAGDTEVRSGGELIWESLSRNLMPQASLR